MVQQPLSGIRVTTPDNLVFDAGVIYANISITALEAALANAWEEAIEDALPIGATRGPCTFNANRELRMVDVNGTIGPVRGMTYRQNIQPTLTATMIEITTANLERMVAGAVSEVAGLFDKISGREIEDESYFENIALAATIKGNDEPVILVLFNVLVHNSPDFPFEDHNELAVEVEFVGHFPLDNTRDETECWRVYRPIDIS